MVIQNRPSNAEILERAEAVYQEKLRATLDTPENHGKILVIDGETGDYEIDTNHAATLERMRVRHPDRLSYSLRIGYPTLGKIGGGWGAAK